MILKIYPCRFAYCLFGSLFISTNDTGTAPTALDSIPRASNLLCIIMNPFFELQLESEFQSEILFDL